MLYSAKVRKYYSRVVRKCVCMAKPSISMPDQLLDSIDERVGVGRSGWIRDAISLKLKIEDEADAYGDLPEQWWMDAINEYLDDRTFTEQTAADAEA